MQPVENVFTDLPGFHCFVCSPANQRGLRLSFFWEEESSEVLTYLQTDETLSGFPRILHGGVQTTVLDELAFWAVFVPFRVLTVTAEINVRFLKPVPTGCRIVARAKGRRPRHRLARVKASLGPEGENPCTEAEILVFVPDRRVWAEQFGGKIPDRLLPYLPES